MDSSVSITRTTLRITNLQLRTIIGFNSWERDKKQDVIINVAADYSPVKAWQSDAIEESLDYRLLKRSIIEIVEESSYNLLESLVHAIIEKIMDNQQILSASIKVDKPHALRFAESVSVEMHAERSK